MGIIQDKAKAIAEDMHKNEVAHHLAFDPMLILTLVGIVFQLVKAYQECKKTPTQTQASIANPGILEKWRLRRIVKTSIDDHEMYDHVGGKITASTMTVGKSITTEEVQQMYNEVV